MRLLQVVTLVSPDGAFGGPVRVADNQAAALRARGHTVVIAAGQTGYGRSIPSELNGTPLRLFPIQHLVKGTPAYSGATSVGLLRWLRGAVRDFDMVHVHFARDLISLPAAAMVGRAGVPYVLQPHGMVIPSGHPFAGALDALLTRRVLRGATAVLHLTDAERRGLAEVGGQELRLRHLGNGVPEAPPAVPPSVPRVLFCSRLQARKRPLRFVEMAVQLLTEGVDAEFVLIGPDGGEGRGVRTAVERHGDPARLRWEGPVEPDEVMTRLGSASLLVLPSVDEPFPMAVLEALSVGLPVVVTDSCGLASQVREHECGIVVDGSQQQLVHAVRSLLTEPQTLARMSRAARDTSARNFGMSSVVGQLEEIYMSSRPKR